MRTRVALKNSAYSLISFFIISVLTFYSRSVFIHSLGNDLAGLSSVLTNILGFLNLAELGIGSAVMFSLYKPILDDDRQAIKGILELYKKMYRFAAVIFLSLAFVAMFFLQYMFKTKVNMTEVRIYFVIYVLNTLLTYLLSYKQSLLLANQQGYIISFIDGTVKIIKIVAQIMALIKFKSFTFYLVIEFTFNLLSFTLINRKIDKTFSWLKDTKGKVENETKAGIFKNIKALFWHQFGSFVVNSTDQVVMSWFVELKYVGMYSNYLMITSFFNSIITKMFDALTASIGNLIAEGDETKIYDVFKKLFFINFYLAVFFTISIYNTIDYFVAVWLGKSYLISFNIKLVMMINFHIAAMRAIIDRFKQAKGIYYPDRYVPIIESTLNFVMSIILASRIGIAGVLIGTMISNLCIVFWIRPKLVYNIVFKKSLLDYMKIYAKYLISFAIIIFVTNFVTNLVHLSYSFKGFIINGIINTAIINLFLIVIFFRTNEFKYFINIISKIVIKNKRIKEEV